jgi:hypothetical protein
MPQKSIKFHYHGLFRRCRRHIYFCVQSFAFTVTVRSRLRRQQEESVSTSTRSRVGFAILTAGLITLTTAFVISTGHSLEAQNATAPANGVITGVVRSDKGPEAGVWVIAETKDLPTNFIKIVTASGSAAMALWIRRR